MPVNKYLEKYGFFGRLIREPIGSNTRLIVVIPAFNEKSVLRCLNSLNECNIDPGIVEAIVVFNSSEHDNYDVRKINEAARLEALNWVSTLKTDRLKFHFITAYELPVKFAGVGFARKIGMDEAVRRFNDIGCTNGIIAGFDADSVCDPNYFREIIHFFDIETRAPGCSIYFEHPLEGSEFDEAVYDGIIAYELHLRYFIQACRYTGHPHAFHTIGSSFAVRNESYQKQGGMNRRKAGEDFYFLQKIIKLGHFKDLLGTKVVPSPRPSQRVPFGTGRAISKWLGEEDKAFMTYHPNTFTDLRNFFQLLPELYINKDNPLGLFRDIPASVLMFLENYYLEDRLKEFDKHTKFINSYVKRFFNWFDAFMVLKFAHFYRDEINPCIPVNEASAELLRLKKVVSATNNSKDLLLKYREIEKQ